MPLKWRKARPVRNPCADFRINTVIRTVAHDLQIEADEIWWLVLTRPDDGKSIDDLYIWALENGFGEDVTIPGEYDPAQIRTRNPGVVSLYARRAYVNAINNPEYKATGIDSFEVGAAMRPQDLTIAREPFLPEDAARRTVPVSRDAVVVAVIDNGMAIGHELFRGPPCDGAPTTRVEFFWNMDGSGTDGDEKTSLGNAWTAEELNRRLKAHFHNDLLDDQGFYAAIGATDWTRQRHVPIAHRLSHGTHVMGLCAGYDADTAEAADRPIIAVNLRSVDVQDPSGTRFGTWLEQALDYIIKRHRRFRSDGPTRLPPLVINFSFGNFAGPHDGTGLIEEKIASALGKLGKNDAPYQFVLPDGNGNQSRCHAALCLPPGGDGKTLPWRVQPGDRSQSGIEFWLDTAGDVPADHLTLTVTGPGVAPVSVDCSTPAPIMDLVDETGKRVGLLFFTPAPDDLRRGVFRIKLYATASPVDVGPFAPAGLWSCHLAAGPGAANAGVKAWILRDQDLPGFPEFGRQSYFDDPSYSRYYEPGIDPDPLDSRLIGGPLGYDPDAPASPVKRSGTLSGFATGCETIVIGGFVRSTGHMALYSASGPTNTTVRPGPDGSARSDDSPVLAGVLSAGSASGSLVAMPGTSVASPQVARWAARRMSAGQAAGRVKVHDTAEAMDPGATDKPPEKRGGGGRMVGLPVLFGDRRRQTP